MNRHLVKVAALILSVGALGLLGCSKNTPLSPTSNGFSDPTFLHVVTPSGGGTARLATTASTTSGSLTGSAQIDGTKGGSLAVGRFLITVPPHAYKGPATITIGIPDTTVLQVNLGISPGAANNFAVPVTLTTDWAGTDVTDPTTLIELWYDPGTSLWVQVPGSVIDPTNETIATPLSHFSEYGTCQGGKVGW